MEDGRTAGIWVLGVLGWLASYAMFGRWLAANDGAFFRAWAESFSTHDFATGLLYDLVAVTAMMVFLAVRDRARLGAWWTAAVLLSLGLSVSMSLAIYLVGRARTRPQPQGAVSA